MCTCYRLVGSACSSPIGLPKLDTHCATAHNYPSIPNSPGLMGDKDRRKERSEVLPRHSSAHIYNNWAKHLSSNKAFKPFDLKHNWNKRFVLNRCHRLEFAFELPKAVPGEARLTQFQVSSSCWETSPAWASGCIPHLQPTSGNGSCQCGSTPGNPVPLQIGEKAAKQRGHSLTSNQGTRKCQQEGWTNQPLPQKARKCFTMKIHEICPSGSSFACSSRVELEGKLFFFDSSSPKWCFRVMQTWNLVLVVHSIFKVYKFATEKLRLVWECISRNSRRFKRKVWIDGCWTGRSSRSQHTYTQFLKTHQENQEHNKVIKTLK